MDPAASIALGSPQKRRGARGGEGGPQGGRGSPPLPPWDVRACPSPPLHCIPGRTREGTGAQGLRSGRNEGGNVRFSQVIVSGNRKNIG